MFRLLGIEDRIFFTEGNEGNEGGSAYGRCRVARSETTFVNLCKKKLSWGLGGKLRIASNPGSGPITEAVVARFSAQGNLQGD
jgi:hypothetical protein